MKCSCTFCWDGKGKCRLGAITFYRGGDVYAARCKTHFPGKLNITWQEVSREEYVVAMIMEVSS